jgi:hypothetical protein
MIRPSPDFLTLRSARYRALNWAEDLNVGGCVSPRFFKAGYSFVLVLRRTVTLPDCVRDDDNHTLRRFHTTLSLNRSALDQYTCDGTYLMKAGRVIFLG